MRTIDLHDAKARLSRLVEQAAQGEPFIIAKAGKPLVKVVALDAADARTARPIGFMAGEITLPDDFDHMGQREVEDSFGAGE